MIWVQSSVCFLVWIVYGLIMRRETPRFRHWIASIPRTRKVIYGAALLLYGMFKLIGGLFGVRYLGLIQHGQFTLSGFLIVAVVGTLFIHSQVMGAMLMIAVVEEDRANLRAQSSKSPGENE